MTTRCQLDRVLVAASFARISLSRGLSLAPHVGVGASGYGGSGRRPGMNGASFLNKSEGDDLHRAREKGYT